MRAGEDRILPLVVAELGFLEPELLPLVDECRAREGEHQKNATLALGSPSTPSPRRVGRRLTS